LQASAMDFAKSTMLSGSMRGTDKEDKPAA
jgi:hypothetical protein